VLAYSSYQESIAMDKDNLIILLGLALSASAMIASPLSMVLWRLVRRIVSIAL
jgi:hypothetical protein